MNKETKIVIGSIFTFIFSVFFITTLARALVLSPSDETDYFSPSIQNSGGFYASSTQAHTTVAARTESRPIRPANTSLWPVRLLIPSLGIDANVQQVGLGKTGNMAVPTNYTDVAWYRQGTIPGDKGSAVFDGHVDNGLALAGVFKHLSAIQPGADIYTVAENGTKKHFKVSAVDIYDYKIVPVETIFHENDRARIRLITCDGAWVAGDKTYDKRLVVSAILVP